MTDVMAEVLSVLVVAGMMVIGFVAGAAWESQRRRGEALTLARNRDELVGQLVAARAANDFLVGELAAARLGRATVEIDSAGEVVDGA
jgi:hypothetical protein